VRENIPIALQSHLDGNATTTCGLLRMELRDGTVFGFTSTNRGLTYDDGDGAVSYARGHDLSALKSTGDLAVDNAEARLLLSAGTPISEAQIIAGELDGAQWSVYQVNYADLSQGHRTVAHGFLGRPKIGKGGAYVALELRTLVDLLRQTPWGQWQRRCRVRRFGSQPGEERYPCMYDLAPEWVTDVVVTAVGVESDRNFTAASLLQADDYFAPGMVLVTSGANEGTEVEVESFAGGVITLAFPLPYPMAEDDTFDIRRECSREWEGHNSCLTFDNREWFRGEPKMRPADALATQIPGARVGPGQGAPQQLVGVEFDDE
jgi:uncharacterized phage protein (TIGR02218 family)